MTNKVSDPVPPVVELDRIAEIFAKVKEFLEVTGFSFWPLRTAEDASPSRKAALSSWTNLVAGVQKIFFVWYPDFFKYQFVV